MTVRAWEWVCPHQRPSDGDGVDKVSRHPGVGCQKEDSAPYGLDTLVDSTSDVLPEGDSQSVVNVLCLL